MTNYLKELIDQGYTVRFTNGLSSVPRDADLHVYKVSASIKLSPVGSLGHVSNIQAESSFSPDDALRVLYDRMTGNPELPAKQVRKRTK